MTLFLNFYFWGTLEDFPQKKLLGIFRLKSGIFKGCLSYPKIFILFYRKKVGRLLDCCFNSGYKGLKFRESTPRYAN
jgi:hypothetical protein